MTPGIPAHLRIQPMPTMTTRSNFLLGLEIYTDDGDAVFSTLSELTSKSRAEDNELLEPKFRPVAWPGDRREVPRVDRRAG